MVDTPGHADFGGEVRAWFTKIEFCYNLVIVREKIILVTRSRLSPVKFFSCLPNLKASLLKRGQVLFCGSNDKMICLSAFPQPFPAAYVMLVCKCLNVDIIWTNSTF